MCTGTLPFRGDTTGAMFDSILNRAPVPSVRINPDTPPKLEDIIHKCLEKDRNLRFQHASEMRADLQRLKRDIESGNSPTARSGTVAVAEAPSAGWGKLWKIAVPVLLVSSLLVVFFYYRSGHRASARLTEKVDFANSTGDPVFDDTLKTALNVALSQSPFLNVLSENKVAATLKLMSRPTNTRLTPDAARELCGAGRRPRGLPADVQQGIHRRINCQSGQPIRAGVAGGELPERRPVGAGAGHSIGEREGARRSGRGGIEAAGRTGRVARNGA